MNNKIIRQTILISIINILIIYVCYKIIININKNKKKYSECKGFYNVSKGFGDISNRLNNVNKELVVRESFSTSTTQPPTTTLPTNTNTESMNEITLLNLLNEKFVTKNDNNIYILLKNYTLSKNKKFKIPEETEFIIENNFTFINDGIIEVIGVYDEKGIFSSLSIVGSGKFINNGTISFFNQSSLLLGSQLNNYLVAQEGIVSFINNGILNFNGNYFLIGNSTSSGIFNNTNIGTVNIGSKNYNKYTNFGLGSRTDFHNEKKNTEGIFNNNGKFVIINEFNTEWFDTGVFNNCGEEITLKIFFSEEQILKNMQTKYPDDYNFYLDYLNNKGKVDISYEARIKFHEIEKKFQSDKKLYFFNKIINKNKSYYKDKNNQINSINYSCNQTKLPNTNQLPNIDIENSLEYDKNISKSFNRNDVKINLNFKAFK